MKAKGRKGYRHLMIAAVLCLLMTMALAAVTVHAAEPVSYLDPADPTADTKVEDYTVLTEEVLAERRNVLETGWYLVSGEVTAEERIIIDGKVDLLLEDESYLKALQGIQVASGKVMVDGEEKTVTDELTIWAQREGSSMGALKAGTGDNIFIAPIGGGEKSGLETTRADAGVITINGGRIEASTDTTRSFATCIGGGYINVYDEERGVFYFMGGNAGKITINGGVVTAINGAYSGTGVGIGGAKDRWQSSSEEGGQIQITGGKVTATGGCGIGSLDTSPLPDIEISGGEVYAKSTNGTFGDGISGKVRILGGTVIAEGSRGYSSFAFYHLRDEGGLILGDPEEHPVKVFTGTDEYNAEIQPAAERIDALRNTKWAKIEVCDHSEFESEEVHGDTIKVGCYCGLSGTMTVPEVSYDTSEKDAMEGESPVYYYDGEEHCPGIRVTAGALELEKGKDYAVSCYDLTREVVTDSPAGPGEYKLILSGRGIHTKYINGEMTFFIRLNEASEGTITFWKNTNISDPHYTTLKVYDGQSIPNKVPEFTHNGHEFQGWYTDRACSAGNEFNIKQVVSLEKWGTQDIDVYAKWNHETAPEEVPATCTKTGLEAHYKCTVDGCDALFRDAEATEPVREADLLIPTVGHTPGDPVRENVIEPGCVESGSFDNVTYCTVCRKRIGFVTTHTDALGHEWIIKDSETGDTLDSIPKKGSYTISCNRCDAEFVVSEDDVHEHGKEMTHHEQQDPTCTESGVRGYYACRCGRYYEDEEAKTELDPRDLSIPATGHEAGEVTTEVVKRASCHEAGVLLKAQYCTHCGYQVSFESSVIPAAHKWDSGKVIKKATTTAEGEILYTCTVCKETRIDPVPKLKPAPKAAKKSQSITAKGKTVKLKVKKLKKKAQKITLKKAITIKNAKGKVTYTKVKVNKKKYAKKFTVNKKTGKITVKKGVKKGKYKLTIKINAAGNSTYKPASKKVTVTIRVK